MTKNKCRFCEILERRDEPMIWESKNFFAVLDVFPNYVGNTLVISKEHLPSDLFGLSNQYISKCMIAAKKVTKILKKGLAVERIAMVMEGQGINHLHIKLYPLHGLKKGKFESIWATQKVFFQKYPGYITTQLGEKIDQKNLLKLINKIKSA